jgi:hypothetical protein
MGYNPLHASGTKLGKDENNSMRMLCLCIGPQQMSPQSDCRISCHCSTLSPEISGMSPRDRFSGH